MFKLKINYAIFLAFFLSSFNPCLSMDLQALFQGLGGDSSEQVSEEAANKVLVAAFIKEHLASNIEFSKKQMAVLATPAILSLVGAFVANKYGYADKVYNSVDGFITDKLNTYVTSNATGQNVIKGIGSPVISTAVVASLLWLVSKTEPGLGAQLSGSEKIALVAVLFGILLASKNEPYSKGIISRYVTDPLLISIIPAILALNVMNKRNITQALQKFMSNYNANEDESGKAYVEQQAKIKQGTQIPAGETITLKNNKLTTPKCLHELFDKMYKGLNAPNSPEFDWSEAVKDFLSTFKKFGISIE